jgi:hypothetical protein
MDSGQLRVVLAMESSLLTSAIQQCLAGNKRLAVEVRPPGDQPTGLGQPRYQDIPRTVHIGLLDDPVRFALKVGSREWIMEYQSLDGLAYLLADLAQSDPAATGVRG